MPLRNLTRFLDSRVILCVLAALLLGYVWLNSYYQLKAAKEDAISAVRRDANNYARIIEEHTTRTIQAADQAALYFVNRYNDQDLQLNIAAFTQQGGFLGDMLTRISVIDKDGNLRLAKLPIQPINICIHREP